MDSPTKEEKRQRRRQRLKQDKVYRTMEVLTRWLDRYWLDAVIGLIPGWGDAAALLSIVPFVYFSWGILRSLPLTLAILNNALRDVLLGMIPFFIGDIIDVFHRANKENMAMIQGFVDGDSNVIRTVNRRTMQSVAFIIALLLLIGLTVWGLIRFGTYMYEWLGTALRGILPV